MSNQNEIDSKFNTTGTNSKSDDQLGKELQYFQQKLESEKRNHTWSSPGRAGQHKPRSVVIIYAIGKISKAESVSREMNHLLIKIEK